MFCQAGDLAGSDDPYLVRVHAVVMVSQDDTQADGISPWHARVGVSDADRKAAALMHSLAGSHALVDGNKRLALLATVVLVTAPTGCLLRRFTQRACGADRGRACRRCQAGRSSWSRCAGPFTAFVLASCFVKVWPSSSGGGRASAVRNRMG